MKVLGPTEYQAHKEFIAAAIAGAELFRTLSPEQQAKLCFYIKLVEFEAGETIVEKGAPGDSFFVVQQGAAAAVERGFFGDRTLGTMGPGDFFGELALILRQPRSATVAALETTRCFMLDLVAYESLLVEDPEIEAQIKEKAFQRYNSR